MTSVARPEGTTPNQPSGSKAVMSSDETFSRVPIELLLVRLLSSLRVLSISRALL